MQDTSTRRVVLKWFAAMAATLVGLPWASRARAEFLEEQCPRVRDTSDAAAGHPEEGAMGCHCTCGGGTNMSSTYSSAAGSGRKKR